MVHCCQSFFWKKCLLSCFAVIKDEHIKIERMEKIIALYNPNLIFLPCQLRTFKHSFISHAHHISIDIRTFMPEYDAP